MTVKILSLSDDGVSSGYGRIIMTVATSLVKRGYTYMGGSIQYDGLLPPTYEGQTLPYWVSAFAGKPWQQEFMKVFNSFRPDVVLVCQDMPYAVEVRNLPLDWSQTILIVITPVDGTPIYPHWVETNKKADGVLIISEFGVQAYREVGVPAIICRPGVAHDVFYRMRDDDKLAMRKALEVESDAFIWGMMAQNQGRKNICDTMRAFFKFAQDKPSARLLMDMEAVSPAGWDIPGVCQQQGWDASKIIFREQAVRKGLVELRERYNVLDLHSVISHREGFGLPLLESMACGVVTMALDWCSGTEVVGEGRGLLIKPIEYTSIGTWGGAEDYFPDVKHMVSEAQRMHDYPHERASIAQRGMEWARTQSWTKAIDNVADAIERAVSKRRAQLVSAAPMMANVIPTAHPLSLDGQKPVENGIIQLQEASITG